MMNMITGFKFIAEQFNDEETEETIHSCSVSKESYGHLILRDKDAVQAVLLLTEVTTPSRTKR